MLFRSDFNAALAKLREAMGEISGAASGMSAGVAEMSRASDDLASRAEHQAASLVQTVPSLALLALFYPLLLLISNLTKASLGFGFPALGFLPALLALSLYAMLPILRNTAAGLAGVDPAVREAARGVGMKIGRAHV